LSGDSSILQANSGIRRYFDKGSRSEHNRAANSGYPTEVIVMKVWLVVSFFLASYVSVQAQSRDEVLPGIAGHRDCRSYFGVMWLDGVPEGQTMQATHYGLRKQQLDWWIQEGNKKNRNVCYVAQIEAKDGVFRLECPSCAADWQKRFRWIVFEHRDEKDKRSNVSSTMVYGAPTNNSGRSDGARPMSSMSVSDPRSRVDYEVKIVATGAAVYSGGSPVRPPSGEDKQLFYYSAEKDKSKKDAGAQVERNDRAALDAASQFIAKDTRH
jgi:hypothetical protein